MYLRHKLGLFPFVCRDSWGTPALLYSPFWFSQSKDSIQRCMKQEESGAYLQDICSQFKHHFTVNFNELLGGWRKQKEFSNFEILQEENASPPVYCRVKHVVPVFCPGQASKQALCSWRPKWVWTCSLWCGESQIFSMTAWQMKHNSVWHKGFLGRKEEKAGGMGRIRVIFTFKHDLVKDSLGNKGFSPPSSTHASGKHSFVLGSQKHGNEKICLHWSGIKALAEPLWLLSRVNSQENEPYCL